MPDCPICDSSFGGEASLRSHARDAHNGCSYCGEEFDTVEELYDHWLKTGDHDVPPRAEQEAADAVGEKGMPLTERYSRRQILAGAGSLGLAALGTAALASAFTSEATPLTEHPAATNFDSQPVIGPNPTEANATIIAFEDPSCTSCRQFEQEVFPQLERQYISNGDLSFVYRGIPVVYPWGEEGVQVLEAVHAQKPDAFNAVKTAYYAQQPRFTKQNVLEESREMLNGLDANIPTDNIINAVGTQEIQEAVQKDVDAARQTNVPGTPTFFLFKDGKFQTRIVGPQRLTIFENALDL